MQKQLSKNSVKDEYVVFRVDKLLCGLNIKSVQEINKNFDLTVVNQSSDFVRGIVNLRGQIVTIIDLRKKMELESKNIDSKMKNIIVRFGDELIGLLVDEVDDIISGNRDEILPNPPHLTGKIGTYFSGVYKVADELVGVLDIGKILNKEK